MSFITEALEKSNEVSEKELKRDMKSRIDSLEEDLITEEEQYVEIPYEEDMLLESFEPIEQNKVRKIGSSEYDSNEGRIKRVNHFRKLANLSDEEQITESLIESKDWAVKQTACVFNRPSARVKAELLNQKYTGLEEYEN